MPGNFWAPKAHTLLRRYWSVSKSQAASFGDRHSRSQYSRLSFKRIDETSCDWDKTPLWWWDYTERRTNLPSAAIRCIYF